MALNYTFYKIFPHDLVIVIFVVTKSQNCDFSLNPEAVVICCARGGCNLLGLQSRGGCNLLPSGSWQDCQEPETNKTNFVKVNMLLTILNAQYTMKYYM